MSWPYLPADYDGPAWVWCPNALYDPKEGHRLYNEYLDLLESSEELGFDGVCVNEHHQNAYGNMPSPNLMAAALARGTKKMKIAVIGFEGPVAQAVRAEAERRGHAVSQNGAECAIYLPGTVEELDNVVDRCAFRRLVLRSHAFAFADEP